MQALIDFLPVVAFVIAYWLADFRTAVAVIMGAMVLQVAVTWLLTRTVNRMTLASAVLVVGLGGVSLVLKNDLVFKWKPTILNWAFAAVFLGSQFVGERTIVQRLLQAVAREQIVLPARDWRPLNLMWVVFFLVSGAANIIVAYRFPEHVWVNFKLFGLLGLTLLFVLAQAAWLSRREGQVQADAPRED
ncbi:MAG: septation protein IspZ [Gammaproteobacteria bacterium]|nr:septation protein IspZ [Gammaproteobacteria bacterium]